MAAKPILTTGELFKAAEISDAEIEAAIDTYIANPQVEPFRFKSGYKIDVVAAVQAHPPAKAAMGDVDRRPKFKHNMVRNGILLAHPVKG
jgi:hypothetical protein